jgi:LuxR family transcriptional regulator, regulator of acetate metabolism
VDDVVEVGAALDRLLPERLRALQRLSGMPVVFGGPTRRAPAGPQLVLTRLVGTVGTSLHGLAVESGQGLGGAVLRHGQPRRVEDYAATTTITHHYDRMVVEEERITSIVAVPVVVRHTVRGVLYGAVRGGQPIGDRALRDATVVARQLQRDLEALVQREDTERPRSSPALDELAQVIAEIPDAAVRTRLLRIHRDLSAGPPAVPTGACGLAPRELETLRLVAVGASNVEIAADLGLSPETVKAYLRAAMRKLDVRNRTAAVHAARRAGAL